MSEQRERAISFDVQRVLPVLTLIPGWPWSLADINEEGGLGGFLIALRRLIEARGGIAETSKKRVYHVKVFTVLYLREVIPRSRRWRSRVAPYFERNPTLIPQ